MENTIKYQQNLLKKFYNTWVDSQTAPISPVEEKEMFNLYQHLKTLIAAAKLQSGATAHPLPYPKPNLDEAVIFLVSHLQPEKIFLIPESLSHNELLVIIPENEHRSFDDLIKLQEHPVLTKHQLSLKLIKASSFENSFLISPIYITVTCNSETLLYDNGYFALPSLTAEGLLKSKIKFVSAFSGGLEKAKVFLAGAKFYSDGNLPMAAFHLHQAAELCLNSLLKSITGRERSTHVLRRLLHSSLSCNPEISSLMSSGQKNDERLLDVLEEAYLGYRYSNNYTVNQADVDVLTEKIAMLCTLTEKTFLFWMGKFDNQILKFSNHG